jgi:putative ABC transport system permease protein
MIHKLSWSLRFAVSEIRDEWLFGLGVALAVCSVLTPTALLWGTKTGMIDTMRTRLLKDPVIRELVGQENVTLPSAWFVDIRKDPRVAFVIPSVRRISLWGNVSVPSSPGKLVEVAYLPTAEGDPVGGGIGWNPRKPQFPVPCMITSRAAEDLGITDGGRIIIEQTRSEDGKTAKAIFEGNAQRVLAPHESNLKAVYLPLPVVERIEEYKDGQAVPLFGWNRRVVPSMLIYDSLRLKLAQTEDKGALNALLGALKNQKGLKLTGDPMEGSLGLSADTDGIEHSQVLEIMREFKAFGPTARLQLDRGGRRSVLKESSKGQSITFSSDDSSWLSYEDVVSLANLEPNKNPPNAVRWFDVSVADGQMSQIGLAISDEQIVNGAVSLSPRLVGIVGAASRRHVEFNELTGEFRALHDQYPGFRLYARDLEDVKPLRQLCESKGIQVRTNEDRIQNVQSLDSALGKFLAFIIVAGGLGGIGALFTSLYLSIERSRRQFAVLQILGIPRFYVLMSTMIQATFMVFVGTFLSFILYHIGALLLSTVLVAGAEHDAKVCSLAVWQWCTLLVASVSCAVLSALMAFMRLRFNDPALIARSE